MDAILGWDGDAPPTEPGNGGPEKSVARRVVARASPVLYGIRVRADLVRRPVGSGGRVKLVTEKSTGSRPCRRSGEPVLVDDVAAKGAGLFLFFFERGQIISHTRVR